MREKNFSEWNSRLVGYEEVQWEKKSLVSVTGNMPVGRDRMSSPLGFLNRNYMH